MFILIKKKRVLANSGRFVRYVVKTVKKRSQRATEAKIKRDEQIRQELRREVELERGMCASSAVQNIPTKLVKDDGNGMGWEEARTN